VPPRDPEATKERILSAATEEFAAKGVAGARIDAIAERARTNKRMLYYYFGSKELLFRAVLRRELSHRVSQSRLQPGNRTERLLARQGEHLRNQAYVRLLQWEALEASGPGVDDDGEREAWYRTWVDAVRAEQAAGRLPDDVDAAQLVLSELALTLFPAAFPQLTRWITGRSVDDPELLAERRAFLEAFAARFLQLEAVDATQPGPPLRPRVAPGATRSSTSSAPPRSLASCSGTPSPPPG
jgi:AcrR family transcriptional regulator